MTRLGTQLYTAVSLEVFFVAAGALIIVLLSLAK